MTWVRSTSRESVVIRAQLQAVQHLIGQVEACGRLMPTLRVLEHRGNQVYRYILDEFSDGAVRFTPDYEARFDLSDAGNVRWEPHGVHDFRSWGCFKVEPGPIDGETVLEISTRAEANIAIDPIMVGLVEPFARDSSEQVTREFLANIKTALERR